MTAEERQLLAALFDRIGALAPQPRDREAEALIEAAVRQHPAAPYVLAQTVLVQDEALRAAAARIQSLEQSGQAEAKEGAADNFVRPQSRTPSGLPGIGARSTATPGGTWGAAAAQSQAAGPLGAAAGEPAGGGFLRNAMTTAAGVAGGALLFQGIQSLFSGKEGEASGLFGTGAQSASADASSSVSPIAAAEHEAHSSSEADLTEAGFDHDDHDNDDVGDDGFDLGGDDGDWT